MTLRKKNSMDMMQVEALFSDERFRLLRTPDYLAFIDDAVVLNLRKPHEDKVHQVYVTELSYVLHLAQTTGMRRHHIRGSLDETVCYWSSIWGNIHKIIFSAEDQSKTEFIVTPELAEFINWAYPHDKVAALPKRTNVTSLMHMITREMVNLNKDQQASVIPFIHLLVLVIHEEKALTEAGYDPIYTTMFEPIVTSYTKNENKFLSRADEERTTIAPTNLLVG